MNIPATMRALRQTSLNGPRGPASAALTSARSHQRQQEQQA